MTDHTSPCRELKLTNEKFEYFMGRTEKDLDYIRDKVDKLWSFRMMLMGGSIAVSAMVSLLINVLKS